MLASCRATQTVSLDSFRVGDSLLAPPRFEPLTAAIAASTNKVALGTAPLLPAFRHRLLVAHSATTVDRNLGGPADSRIRRWLQAWGGPFDHRLGGTIESIEMLRRFWCAKSQVEFQGRRSRFANLEPLPRSSWDSRRVSVRFSSRPDTKMVQAAATRVNQSVGRLETATRNDQREWQRACGRQRSGASCGRTPYE
jgi:alkanesulfonate monooxygenase SsuD/methylene tetrahydromethanopterin reductase-like flavin-dependent oxidoreductase (luciferase family)